MGHEYVGVVEDVGANVTTVETGQFVVGSFFASDNTCEICAAGYQSRCVLAESMGAIGTQAEYARLPLADGTLVVTPDVPDEKVVPSLLATSDVLGTGWFAAVAADVAPGKTVAVVGDGAVGLLGVLAARELGAERVIVSPGTSNGSSSPASSAPPTVRCSATSCSSPPSTCTAGPPRSGGSFPSSSTASSAAASTRARCST